MEAPNIQARIMGPSAGVRGKGEDGHKAGGGAEGCGEEERRGCRCHEHGAAAGRAESENLRSLFLPTGLGLLFFAAALAAQNRGVPGFGVGTGIAAWFTAQGGIFTLGLFAAAYLLTGGKVLLRALKNIRKGEIFDENFLMAIASLGAFCIGEYPEAVAVMIFYRVGEAFQETALRRSRASITALMDIRPDYANLMRGTELVRVDPRNVHPGDRILVKPGEKVPLDGLIAEGRSALDCSALTGESLPRDVEPGDEALSGSINKTGVLTLTVSREFGESTASKILRLVEDAGNKKAPVENFITRFARYYTPAVVGVALLLALVPPLVQAGAYGGGFAAGFAGAFPSWLHRALVFLVVSCPCALVISVPLSFFGGIGGASRRGILVKGGNYLEALNRAGTVIFDKTGTLTRGIFKVARIVSKAPFSADEVLGCAAAAEQFSNHPIALSIRNAAGERGLAVDRIAAASRQEIPGQGVRLSAGGAAILAGNRRLLEEHGVPCPAVESPGTVVYVARAGVYAGHLEIGDEPKADAAAAIRRLRAAGIRRILMFTGDNARTAEDTAAALGLDGVYGELLPQDKVAQLEALYAEVKGKGAGGEIVFVGDGINDAPVLARSDVGVAMGKGQDAAIEAADIVLMTDEPSRLADAVAIARKTHRVVVQNIALALALKGVILVLGALGLASMWAAVFGDVGVSCIAILNALRAQRV
ncbi:MAG: heavy metal translocating P-type ATPase [Treponema sp.]|jgi:Cd2+/Zn2+-exporting ATPase|nr:heavy metal translocating P-type ATPase [Treponema sp.]